MATEDTYPSIGTLDEPTGAFAYEEDTEDVAPKERKAMLLVLVGPEAGRTHVLSKPVEVIGRGEEADFRIAEGNVSRQHAELRRAEDGRYQLKDLRSRNGISVNGKRVESAVLSFGDRISIGREVMLLFAPHDHLQEELIRQQRIESLGQLATGVAHDFNNLLAIILGNLTVIDDLPARSTLGDGEVGEICGEIKEAATRAAQLAGQLLAFSRRSTMADTVVDLSAVVTETMRLAHRALGSKVTVKTQVPAGLMVRGDSTQLHQVVMNLVLNARDAMPQGGSLSVSLDADRLPNGDPAPHWKLIVSDTGTGMDQATQARIFEPYFTTKALGRGTGLGLATVLGIVRAHGGRVRVESEPEKGSTFVVELPRAVGGRASRARTEGSLNALSSLPKRILVVDDEDAYLRCVARLLKAWGFEVSCAKSASAALELLDQAQAPIGIVLVDYMMPEMRGDELTQEILRRPNSPRVMVMSGYSDPEMLNRLRAAGASGFVNKPFTRHQLEGAIYEAFNPS